MENKTSQDKEKEFLEIIDALNSLRKWLIIFAITTAVLFLVLSLFGCKSKDIVTVTEDGWRMHSAVDVDTFRIDKTLQ